MTHIVIFGIGSACSKGTGLNPGPGTGSLYKVCPFLDVTTIRTARLWNSLPIECILLPMI